MSGLDTHKHTRTHDSCSTLVAHAHRGLREVVMFRNWCSVVFLPVYNQWHCDTCTNPTSGGHCAAPLRVHTIVITSTTASQLLRFLMYRFVGWCDTWARTVCLPFGGFIFKNWAQAACPVRFSECPLSKVRLYYCTNKEICNLSHMHYRRAVLNKILPTVNSCACHRH